jgi:hypothetical protein
MVGGGGVSAGGAAVAEEGVDVAFAAVEWPVRNLAPKNFVADDPLGLLIGREGCVILVRAKTLKLA